MTGSLRSLRGDDSRLRSGLRFAALLLLLGEACATCAASEGRTTFTGSHLIGSRRSLTGLRLCTPLTEASAFTAVTAVTVGAVFVAGVFTGVFTGDGCFLSRLMPRADPPPAPPNPPPPPAPPRSEKPSFLFPRSARSLDDDDNGDDDDTIDAAAIDAAAVVDAGEKVWPAEASESVPPPVVAAPALFNLAVPPSAPFAGNVCARCIP